MVGIRVDELVTASPDKVHVDFVPITTRFCDLCAERTGRGESPACVKHCQASCMTYGPVTELAKAMEKQPRSSLFAPR
jgi:Fe-S-cluster-containing dehydrogenase component